MGYTHWDFDIFVGVQINRLPESASDLGVSGNFPTHGLIPRHSNPNIFLNLLSLVPCA